MPSRSVSRRDRLRAVVVSAMVGTLAGAGWPLVFALRGDASWTNVFEWALAGLLLGACVAIVCVVSTRVLNAPPFLTAVAMVSGLMLAYAMSWWIFRGDAEVADGLIVRSIMGLALGVVIAVTVRGVTRPTASA